jgi:hypothetical protein
MATSVAALSAPYGQRKRIEHELDLVEGAVAMVARGEARRVSLVVGHGALILPVAQASGRRSGVIVRAAWRTDNANCDLVVEPVG